MPDATASDDYQFKCPDCGKTFDSSTETVHHHKWLCDGDGDEIEPDTVWIGAKNPANADGKRIYHTDPHCFHVYQMANSRSTTIAALTDDWRECHLCQMEEREVDDA